MNQKGFGLIVYILIAFIIIALIPPIIMRVFPAADILMRIFLTLLIFATVRAHLGSNALTIIISAALVYLLVIRHGYLTASLYVFFFVLLMMNFLSVIIWGLSKFGRH